MTLYSLQQFEALANYQSFSKAAETLFISQSALSHTIQALETELEVSLWERRGQQIILSPQGEQFRMYCRKVLDEHENLQMELNDRNDPFVNPLRLQMQVGFYPQRLLIRTFLNQYPRAKIQIYQAEQGRMACYSLDLMIFTDDTAVPGDDAVFLFEEPLVLVTHRDHPLASLPEIRLEDLQDYPGIQMQSSSSEKAEQLFRERGIYLSPILETDHFHFAIRMLRNNEGWALMPRYTMVPENDPLLCTRVLRELDVRRRIWIQPVKSRYISTVMKLFLDHSRAFFSGWGDSDLTGRGIDS